jgi:hypothetical protein
MHPLQKEKDKRGCWGGAGCSAYISLTRDEGEGWCMDQWMGCMHGMTGHLFLQALKDKKGRDGGEGEVVMSTRGDEGDMHGWFGEYLLGFREIEMKMNIKANKDQMPIKKTMARRVRWWC